MVDTFGFEIKGYSDGNTPSENIKAIESHIEILNGLHNEEGSEIV